MRLSADFTFDAAHRLLGHKGEAGSLHDHTYTLEVTVSSEHSASAGALRNAEDLRALVKEAVLDRWDNATLLWSEDPLVTAIDRVEDQPPEKIVLLPETPTSEALTREAWQAISQNLPPGVRLERLTIRETPACSSG